MRSIALILVSALGLATAAVSANATPVVHNLAIQQPSSIVEVAGGCGPGAHPNRWGRCVPFRYGYYGPRPYWRGAYYARRWGGSDDYSAEQLNRQQLGQFNRY
jgi:hypothetical protein